MEGGTVGARGWGPEPALSRAWNAPLPPARILAAAACGLTRQSASRAAVSPFLQPPSACLAALKVSKWHPVDCRDSASPPRNRPERRERAEAAEPGGRRAERRRRMDPVPLSPKRSLDFCLCSQRLAAPRSPWLGFPVLRYYSEIFLSQEYFFKFSP